MVDEIEELGATMVAVSPQLPEHSRALIDEHGLDFEILHDEGGEVARRYGLWFALPEDLAEAYRQVGIDLEEANGDDQWSLPMPARYVIDADGTVRWASVHPDYTTRPEPEETLDALRELEGG